MCSISRLKRVSSILLFNRLRTIRACAVPRVQWRLQGWLRKNMNTTIISLRDLFISTETRRFPGLWILAFRCTNVRWKYVEIVAKPVSCSGNGVAQQSNDVCTYTCSKRNSNNDLQRTGKPQAVACTSTTKRRRCENDSCSLMRLPSLSRFQVPLGNVK